MAGIPQRAPVPAPAWVAATPAPSSLSSLRHWAPGLNLPAPPQGCGRAASPEPPSRGLGMGRGWGMGAGGGFGPSPAGGPALGSQPPGVGAVGGGERPAREALKAEGILFPRSRRWASCSQGPCPGAISPSSEAARERSVTEGPCMGGRVCGARAALVCTCAPVRVGPCAGRDPHRHLATNAGRPPPCSAGPAAPAALLLAGLGAPGGDRGAQALPQPPSPGGGQTGAWALPQPSTPVGAGPAPSAQRPAGLHPGHRVWPRWPSTPAAAWRPGGPCRSSCCFQPSQRLSPVSPDPQGL